MSRIATLLWDVGGVLLTNGWDTASRQRAVEQFDLDWDSYEERHQGVVEEFETGRLRLDAYIERVVRPDEHGVDRESFRDFMLSRSRLHPECALDLVDRLAGSEGLLQVTLNNESLDLNLHRIAEFDLRGRFVAFFSSCFLGVKKPDPGIYRKALWIAQRDAEECLFVDDRESNLEPARDLGMRTILFEDHASLAAQLEDTGLL